ncbi:DUF5331 domain-containing protein, partial [Kamptonema sp. PCC 6506]|uniref:DUF5331 domain-containing protein n=2 Tax=Kamptonema TaxID=1501433 RepID=UPI0014433DD3
MAFFEDLSGTLKQKWLQYYQANRSWLVLQMQVQSVSTPDGGRRPPSYLILGVLNALEPNLEQLMLPFTRLNPDPETLIEVLGLNFDPDVALGISSSEVVPPAIASVPTVTARPAQAPPVVPPTPSAAPAAVPAATTPAADNSNVMGGIGLAAAGVAGVAGVAAVTSALISSDEESFGDLDLEEESDDLAGMGL